MVFDGIRAQAEARGRDKAIQWYLEIKKLEAELAAARARLLALQTSAAVSAQVGRLPAVGGPTEPVREQLERMRNDAEENLTHVAKALDNARRRWEKAKKAKDTYDHMKGQENPLSDMVAKADSLASNAGEALDRVAAAAGDATATAVTETGDATSSADWLDRRGCVTT